MTSANSTWQPASAPLTTRWTADVSPEHVRPEYPRPLLVRKNWQSLNGIWQFAFDDNDSGDAQGWQSETDLNEQILVPFTFEAALSGIGKGEEIHEHVWYRKLFSIPANWREAGTCVKLNFGAVDWQATVYVNGVSVGSHTGGYAPFSIDITDAMVPGDVQEVVVSVYDPADPKTTGFQPRGKQLGTEGIWYTRTTGIWQSVWIEPVSTTSVSAFRTESDVKSSTLSAHVTLTGENEATAQVKVFRNGVQVASQSEDITGSGVVTISVPDPELWSPDSPALYNLEVTIVRDGIELDSFTSYTAFRSYGIENARLVLNGEPFFVRGVLDQGYWPDGILTPPTDDAIRYDVEMTKKLGFNVARKHVKIEDPRWYYWCDVLGVAVWQDMPSPHNLSSAEARSNFTAEWKEVMEALRGYPCVLHWIPFNENWGNPEEFQDEIVLLTRSLDTIRPITDASGWTQRSLTDVDDVHDYGNELLRHGVAEPLKPKVVGEYGGIALPIPGHTWAGGWGYQTAKDAESLLKGICFQTTQLFDAANLSGYVYTQLTDVELELNGLLTYDREPKADPALFAQCFTGTRRALEK